MLLVALPERGMNVAFSQVNFNKYECGQSYCFDAFKLYTFRQEKNIKTWYIISLGFMFCPVQNLAMAVSFSIVYEKCVEDSDYQ